MQAQEKAHFAVDKQVFNFGSIKEAKGLASHVFTIRNTGDVPLVITRVTASCGCTRPEWTKEPIAVGASGILKVTYNPKGRPGPFYKTITIYSNAEKPRYNLAIKGNVIPKPKVPTFVYPYAIGNLKLHTKEVLYNNLRQNETLGEKISIKNEGKTSLTVELGKLPHFLAADIRPTQLKPGEVGEITFLMDGHAIKHKGRKVLDITHHLFLPVTVLFTLSLAGLQRQMRGNLLDVLDSDYVKFARAKGLSEGKVIFKHALRNAVNPLITLLGFEFAGLLSGAALTEYVFQYPGLGRLILEAVLRSDINLVMASLMMGAVMLILGNLIADILLIITDPRIREGSQA